MKVRKKLIIHKVYYVKKEEVFDRNNLKFLDSLVLRELTILKKVDIVIDIIEYLINQIYSNGVDIKIFKTGEGKEIEIEEDIEFNIKQKKKLKNKQKIDNLNNDLFPSFEIFRTKEMELERRWVTFYRDLISNFLVYGFAIVKYKKKDDDLVIPELLDPFFDCTIAFRKLIDKSTEFYIFNSSAYKNVENKWTSVLMEDVRLIEYNSLDRNYRLFNSKVYNIRHYVHFYSQYIVNNAKTDHYLANPPRIYNDKDTDKMNVRTPGNIVENIDFQNVIYGNQFKRKEEKKSLENRERIKTLNNELKDMNNIHNIDGERYEPERKNGCFNNKKRYKKIDLLRFDRQMPISFESIIPPDMEINPNNEIKTIIQPKYIEIIKDLKESISVGLGIRPDLIFPSIGSRLQSTNQEMVANDFNKTISNWQYDISLVIHIIYGDIMLPQLHDLLNLTLKKEKKMLKPERLEKIWIVLSSISIDISFRPNQKLNLTGLAIFQEANIRGLISDEDYLNFATNVYSLRNFAKPNPKNIKDKEKKKEDNNSDEKKEEEKKEEEKKKEKENMETNNNDDNNNNNNNKSKKNKNNNNNSDKTDKKVNNVLKPKKSINKNKDKNKKK